MSDNLSPEMVGAVTEISKGFLNKIADATGILYKPLHVVRMAKAQVKANKIRLLGEIELQEIRDRVQKRLTTEEVRNQLNIENIIEKSIPQLSNPTGESSINEDWLSYFFEKAKLVSEEEMQDVWSKILANEANTPGSFSKRTIDFISTITKDEAELFTKLCSFKFEIGNSTIVVDELDSDIWKSRGIYFSGLKQLDQIGLLEFESLAGFVKNNVPKLATIEYYNKIIVLDFPLEENNKFEVGKVFLSRTGQELSRIAGGKYDKESLDFVLNMWAKKGIKCLQIIDKPIIS